jgi:hypothetical protein
MSSSFLSNQPTSERRASIKMYVDQASEMCKIKYCATHRMKKTFFIIHSRLSFVFEKLFFLHFTHLKINFLFKLKKMECAD